MRAIFLSALALTATASAKKLIETTVTTGIGDLTANIDASGTTAIATGTAALKVAAADIMELSATGSFSRESDSAAEFAIAATLKFDSSISDKLNDFCSAMDTAMGDDICGLAGYDTSTSSITLKEFKNSFASAPLDPTYLYISTTQMVDGMGSQAKIAKAFLQALGIDITFGLGELVYDGTVDAMPLSFKIGMELAVLDWDTHNLLDAYNTATDSDLSSSASYCTPGNADYDDAKCTLRGGIIALDTASCETFFEAAGGNDKSLWKEDINVFKTMNDARRVRGRSLAMTLPEGVSINNAGILNATLGKSGDEGGSSTLIIILVILAIVGVGAGAGFAYKQKQATKK